ncbi:unnamed protein product [Linum trigynum]|uniref:Uncharacterized protein n=1 Tax=Linum trigynum TaxID=586398 RepID=A0AAV2DTL1_9ROSI
MVIDGGSFTNVVSLETVGELGLSTFKHHESYNLHWLNDHGAVKVTKQAWVEFEIDQYNDRILCDIAPMHVAHILLGRTWQYDSGVTHHGRSNCYTFQHEGKKLKPTPLSPVEVRDDKGI